MKRQIMISAAALLAASSLTLAQGPQGGPGQVPGGGPGQSPGGPAVQSAPPAGGTVTPGPGGTPPTGIPEKMEREPIGKGAGDAGKKGERSAGERSMKDGKSAAETEKGSKKGMAAESGKTGKSEKDARQSPPGSSGKAADKDMKSGKDGKQAKDTATKEGKAGGRAAAVSVPEAKKPEVRSAFRKHRVAPARNVNFSINVGVAVPRTIVLHPVPREVVVIYPAYRQYRYFYVDDRICIVDPDTFVIVDVIVLTA